MRDLFFSMRKLSYLFVFVLLFNIVGTFGRVNAAETTLKPQIAAEYYKSWKVQFNSEIDMNTINMGTVKILDEQNNAIAIRFSQGESSKQLIVIPVQPYENNKKYTLVISDTVKSKKGVSLKKSIYMDFTVDVKSSEGYIGSGKVYLGLGAAKTVTIYSSTLSEIKKYRVKESMNIVNLGESSRAFIPSESTTIYFYSEDEELLGTADISLKENNSNLIFNIKR